MITILLWVAAILFFVLVGLGIWGMGQTINGWAEYIGQMQAKRDAETKEHKKA